MSTAAAMSEFFWVALQRYEDPCSEGIAFSLTFSEWVPIKRWLSWVATKSHKIRQTSQEVITLLNFYSIWWNFKQIVTVKTVRLTIDFQKTHHGNLHTVWLTTVCGIRDRVWWLPGSEEMSRRPCRMLDGILHWEFENEFGLFIVRVDEVK